MPVFGLVARRAVQERFFGSQLSERGLRRGAGFFEPAFDLRHVHACLLRLALQLFETNPGEGCVAAHFGGGIFDHSPRVVEIATGGLEQEQFVFDLLADVGEQIADGEPTYDDE